MVQLHSVAQYQQNQWRGHHCCSKFTKMWARNQSHSTDLQSAEGQGAEPPTLSLVKYYVPYHHSLPVFSCRSVCLCDHQILISLSLRQSGGFWSDVMKFFFLMSNSFKRMGWVDTPGRTYKQTADVLFLIFWTFQHISCHMYVWWVCQKEKY